jgi:hypothetical protein
MERKRNKDKNDETFDTRAKYDEEYLKELREKAKKTWLDKIDTEQWLKEVKGGYD